MLLVAMPQLGDPNFFRSVVLMMLHDPQGALGLVINNPMELTLGDFAQSQDLPCHPELKSLIVYSGGPVDPQRGWVLHNEEDVPEKRKLAEGLFVSGSKDTLRILLENGREPFRLILGYAGWGAHQLENEMAQGAWLTAKMNVNHVFHTDPAQTWNAVLSELGVNPANLAVGHGIH